jgi:hypothetical protein
MTMTGSAGTNATNGNHVMKVDRTILTRETQKMYLKASTRGLKSVNQYIEYQVCAKDALRRKASHANATI